MLADVRRDLKMDPKIAPDDDCNDDYADDVKDHCPNPRFRRRLGYFLTISRPVVLHAVNGILDLACGQLGLAVRLQLAIAYYLADGYQPRRPRSLS